jgi:hypothetical protein
VTQPLLSCGEAAVRLKMAPTLLKFAAHIKGIGQWTASKRVLFSEADIKAVREWLDREDPEGLYHSVSENHQ